VYNDFATGRDSMQLKPMPKPVIVEMHRTMALLRVQIEERILKSEGSVWPKPRPSRAQ